MNDMSSAIQPKSDQMNADDLIGGPRTITVTKVDIKAGEQPVSIHYEGDGGKPYKPCKSMCRVLVHNWGADANKYAGKSLTIYNDPEVTWAGMKVGGIRISHLSHIERDHTMALTATRGHKKPFTVKPLRVPGAPQYTPEQLRAAAAKRAEAIIKRLSEAADETAVTGIQEAERETLKRLESGYPDLYQTVIAAAQRPGNAAKETNGSAAPAKTYTDAELDAIDAAEMAAQQQREDGIML